MEMPPVSNKIRDPKTGVTYDVKAYRKLSRAEMVLSVRMHLANTKHRGAPGTTVVILTIIDE